VRAGGYDLQTLQQVLTGRNLGSLIGKVVIGVTLLVDEQTKEERQEEAAVFFYVGAESRVEMPAKGRLFLGINENVIGDNAGEFRVTVTAPRARDLFPTGTEGGLFSLAVDPCLKPFHELGVVLALDEVGIGQDLEVEGEVGFDPDHCRHLQRGLHLLDGQRPRRRLDRDLSYERIVIGGILQPW